MAKRESRFELGRTAADVLRRTAGPCVIRDIFYPVLGSARPPDPFEPSEELMLGVVLREHFEAFERADAGEELTPDEETNALVERGIRAAHDDLVAELENTSGKLNRLVGALTSASMAVTAHRPGAWRVAAARRAHPSTDLED
jgi:hypothetical protein